MNKKQIKFTCKVCGYVLDRCGDFHDLIYIYLALYEFDNGSYCKCPKCGIMIYDDNISEWIEEKEEDDNNENDDDLE